MLSATTTVEQNEVPQFLQASLRAVVRAEAQGRLPARFTGTGVAVWETFRNELTAADLVALAIQDAGVTMPVPFDPRVWWSGWPDWTLFQASEDAERWIQEALEQADLPRDAYLREQAAFLEIGLPADAAVTALPTPASHERWLELPGTGGWLAYALCQRPDATPPRTELPIRLDDPGLTATLKARETYHAVVGLRELHGHRDLRVLHQNGKQPLWL
jgi:hypothetical protein